MAGKSNAPETNVIVPRNYGVVISSGSNTFFCDPARYVIGHIALTTQSQLFRWLSKWQNFKQDETLKHKEGSLNYEPKFPIKGKEDLLSCPVEELENIIVDAILKKEGCKNLWEKGGKQTIQKTKFRGNSLEGRIRAKKGGFANVHINNPFVTPEGTIQYDDVYCSKPEGNYEAQKGFRVMCSHNAGLETAQFMQLKGMKDLKGNPLNFIIYEDSPVQGLSPTLAFDFVSDPFLSNLEIDVLFAHYLKKESFYKINRKLTDILEHYSTDMTITGKNGLAKFAVMRHDSMDFNSKKYKRSRTGQELENRWLRNIRRKIRSMGFRQTGLDRTKTYTVAFKGGPYETIAERYEKGDEVIEIASFPQYAPLFVSKKLYGDIDFHSPPMPYNDNPFLNLNIRRGRLISKGVVEDTRDDYSRRRCEQMVFVPKSVFLPKKIESFYRRMVREAQVERETKKQIELIF